MKTTSPIVVFVHSHNLSDSFLFFVSILLLSESDEVSLASKSSSDDDVDLESLSDDETDSESSDDDPETISLIFSLSLDGISNSVDSVTLLMTSCISQLL